MNKTIKITDQAWLEELDPNKNYVLMFKGSPSLIKWEDKPANVSSVILSADRYTIEDIKLAEKALGLDE